MLKISHKKFCKSFLVMISITYSKGYYMFLAWNWLNFYPRIKNLGVENRNRLTNIKFLHFYKKRLLRGFFDLASYSANFFEIFNSYKLSLLWVLDRKNFEFLLAFTECFKKLHFFFLIFFNFLWLLLQFLRILGKIASLWSKPLIFKLRNYSKCVKIATELKEKWKRYDF
jgi:hypothetical protein